MHVCRARPYKAFWKQARPPTPPTMFPDGLLSIAKLSQRIHLNRGVRKRRKENSQARHNNSLAIKLSQGLLVPPQRL